MEQPIEYGDAFERYLTFHFSFLVPTGQVFGSNTSAQNFELFAKARTLLARYIFETEDCAALVAKYSYLIDKVQFQSRNEQLEDFIQSKRCPFHTCIIKQNGTLKLQPFIMFVDDNLMVDTRLRMKYCMAASLEALFRTMDHDKPEICRSNGSVDKYFSLTVSHIQTQLGLEVNTRDMTVLLPSPKKQDLTNILSHWHGCRKSFVIKEASSLLGKLNYAAEVASCARLLFVAIRSSLLACMCKNKRLVMNRSHFKQILADANNPNDDNISILQKKFALSKLTKSFGTAVGPVVIPQLIK